MNSTDTNTIEIDVLYLLRKLWNAKVLILFSALFFGILSLLISVLLIKPTYTSSTRIYVVNQMGEKSITAQDLQAGSYLVNDYKEIITSSAVMSDTIQKEGLAMSEGQLSSMISVSIPADTRIITISVNSHDAEEAQRLANGVRKVAAEKIKEVTKVEDVTTIEEAKVPEKPTSPNTKRNVLLGVLAGGFLSVAGVLLKELLDDHVRRPEDIEEVLGLVLIGVVPNSEKL
ncbi:Wzz/FepE/Etk N-terminal domain-containing protein [Streptococcus ovis]|uniref:Wzz/FepE/Etk N-terminal domain-containing protein n=1 Tax=Streptococcus ovis TaxID=82806 RepID=UPI00035C741A|nr:Wzz/FepE/Etk N-terminal domain-containing protein [Streptococcus ovis]